MKLRKAWQKEQPELDEVQAQRSKRLSQWLDCSTEKPQNKENFVAAQGWLENCTLSSECSKCKQSIFQK
jgi:hypothetical protein